MFTQISIKYFSYLNKIKKYSIFNNIYHLKKFLISMSNLKKYNDYLTYLPINIQFRIGLTKDNDGLLTNNSIYYGPRKDQMKHGSYGIYIQKKIDETLHVMEGEWKSNQFSGKGSYYIIPKPEKNQPMTLVWRQGEWLSNGMKGRGTIKEYDQRKKEWKTVYIGTFLHNQKHGLGVAYFDGKKYQGQFNGGCFSGQGRLTKSQNNYQDGTFQKGKFLGKGIERRGSQFLVYSRQHQCQIYSTPFNVDHLSSFYQNLIERLCLEA